MMGQRCLLCPKTTPPPPSHPGPHGRQHVKEGASEDQYVELVQPMGKETLEFIYKILDWDFKQGSESTLCFCNGCAFIFNSVVSIYIKLHPLLEEIKKHCKKGFGQEPMGQPGFTLDQDSTMLNEVSKRPTCRSPIIPIKVEVEEDIQEEMEVEMQQGHFHWEDALSGDYDDRHSTTTSPSPTPLVDPLEIDVKEEEMSSNTAACASNTFIGVNLAYPPPPLVELVSRSQLQKILPVADMVQKSVSPPVFSQALPSTSFKSESQFPRTADSKDSVINSSISPPDLDVDNLHNSTQTSSCSKSIPLPHEVTSRLNAGKCIICHVPLGKNELESHLLDIHRTWMQPYYCLFCTAYKSHLPNRWWMHVVKFHLKKLLHCDVCDKHFTHTKIFEAHKVGHGVDGPVICGICGKNLPDGKSFYQHLIYSHSATVTEKPVKEPFRKLCELCDRMFTTVKGLKRHMECHLDKEQRKLSCEVCDMTFLGKTYLLKHLHKVHEADLNLEKKLKCTICGKMYVSSLTLQQHEGLHQKFDAGNINAQCNICKFSPKDHEKLVQHFEEVHMNQEQPKSKKFVKCTVEDCDYSVTCWRYLKIHERKHHPYLLVHECQLCDKRYSTPEFLETHALTHGDGPFECKVCTTGKYLSAEKLSQHLSRHNGDDTFKCDKCSEGFSDRVVLRKHKIKIHDEASPFECTECGKKCTGKYDLEQHKARNHPLQDAVKFHCAVCSQAFNTKQQLSSHSTNVHSDKSDRYVHCEICGLKVPSTYMQLHTLRNHKRNELETAKKKICYFCDKKFLLSGELIEHMHTHTGERPFICYICRKDFRQSHCLNSHLKLHKKNGTFYPKPEDLKVLA